MKNNPLALMLIVILLLSALGNSWLAFSYNTSMKKLRAAQRDPTILKVQNNQAAVQMFVNDLLDYSRTHPAMNPILQSVGIGGTAATPVAGVPAKSGAPSAAKPGGK